MSKFLLSILLSTLLLFTTSVAGSPANSADREEMRALKMEQAKLKKEEHLLQLKQALNLQQHQLAAWTTYETHMKENIGNNRQMIQQLKQSQADSGIAPSSLQIAEANVARLEGQLVTAKERLAVFSDLYHVLDAEQQATIDKLTHRKLGKAARKMRHKRDCTEDCK